MSKQERLICVGEITSAHGTKGEVKLKSFTADPAAVAGYKPLTDEKETREFKIKISSQNNEMLIISINGVSNREEAEAMRGTRLYFERAKLPKPKKGQFYFSDLKGLKAIDENGADAGVVSDVMNFGGGDIVAIQNGPREYMLPFKAPFVGDPDLEAGTLPVSIPADYPFSEKKPPKTLSPKDHRNQKKKPKGAPADKPKS